MFGKPETRCISSHELSAGGRRRGLPEPQHVQPARTVTDGQRAIGSKAPFATDAVRAAKGACRMEGRRLLLDIRKSPDAYGLIGAGGHKTCPAGRRTAPRERCAAAIQSLGDGRRLVAHTPDKDATVAPQHRGHQRCRLTSCNTSDPRAVGAGGGGVVEERHVANPALLDRSARLAKRKCPKRRRC